MLRTLLPVLLLATPIAAQPTNWSPVAMIQVRRPTTVAPSPDGRRVAYTVRAAVLDDGKSEYLTHIHLADADGTNSVQLTRGDKSCEAPQWSPDGRTLAFLTGRSGKPNVWLLPVAGGEAEQLTDVPTAVTSFQWAPDGASIAYVALDGPSLSETRGIAVKDDAKVLDENVKLNRLYAMPVEKDGNGKRMMRLLTLGSFSIADGAFDWSPDSKSIVVAHTKTPKADDWPSADLSVVDVASGKVRSLGATGSAETFPKYSPDGRSIAFVRSDDPPRWAGYGRACVMPAVGGTARELGETPDQRPTLFGWAKDGQSLYVGEVFHTDSRVYRLPLDGGSPTAILERTGTAIGLFQGRDRVTVGFGWESADQAPEAFVANVETMKPVRVSRMNEGLPKRPFGKTEAIRWKSSDGTEVEGLLTYPVGYEKGTKVPLLVVIHGGPAGVFTNSYIANAYPYPVAAFAGRGYAVLRPNPRGSSGYGKAFRFANHRDWGGGDFQDIMTGVDAVIARGVADPERMGVMGWSYGGFMTSWTITQTKRFKAASVGAGVTNLVSFTGTADIPSFIPDYFGKESYDDDAIYRAHSAMFRVKGVTTPTLIQHGANDERVPLSQGMELYNALKRQGCTTKMVVYPRMPHGITEPRLLMDAMARNLDWFDRHVRGIRPMAEIKPPATRAEVVAETLHGIEIADRYRWLEDQDSPETRAWIGEQQKYAEAVFEQLPGRETIRKRLTELLRTDSMGAPTVRNGLYFYSKRSASQDLSMLFVRKGLTGKDEVLIDSNALSKDGSVSATMMDVAHDGSTIAYGLRKGGEDEVEIRLMDVATKRDRNDKLPRGRYFGVDINRDKTGLYFARMTKEGPRVFFRPLGYEGAEEKELFGQGYGPEKIISCRLDDSGKYLLISVLYGSAATKTEVYVLDAATQQIRTIVKTIPARFAGSIGGDTLFLQTNWNAPNGKLLAVDLNAPEMKNWKEIVSENKSAAMSGVSPIDGKLFVSYTENVASKQKIFTASGKHLGDVKYPAPGSGSVSGRWDSKEAFFNFNSFVQPATVYRYDADKGIEGIWSKTEIPLKSEDTEVKQVHYRSKDGTEVPMYVVHKKGLKLDGSAPTFLTGYGGFNLNRLPSFSALAALWVEMGGVYALPALRGGGEFGEAWHRAGMLAKKQTTFDDFIAAGEWLVKEGYTKPEKLAIAGGSNGGLLVGAAMTQRPELFRAVVCSVPLLDMVRYHKFLVARFWVPEYGSSEDAEQFKWLHAYSPYHKVKSGVKYPGVLFVTGDADTRVAPLHARKMCALLQAETGSGTDRPILLSYDTKGGHAGGKPITKQIDETTDELAFLFWQLGVAVK